MTTLLITRCLPDAVVEAARARFDVTYRDEETTLDETAIADALARYDAILPTLGDAVTAAAFAGAGKVRCRLLANFGVGYNHIDVAAARAAGVAVTNTPGAVTDATADIALTLMLATCRRAGEGERMLRAGNWGGWHPTQLLGQHVSGKVAGIVGMGRIGRAIARRCHHGFGMDIVFHNRSKVADPGVPARQLEGLADVARTADVLFAAVPASPQTHHLISAEVLSAMRATAVLINISRGDVVDETALIAALEAGHIAGAGLDVYEFEPKVPEALRRLEQVTLLPHLGTNTLDVRQAMGMMAVDNLIAFFEGKPVPNPV